MQPSRTVSELRLKGLRKSYGGVPAVRDFELCVEPGEFVVLVGPSGCGKSTVLRMVAGLEETDTGYVEIGGREVTHLPPRDRDVAMVFQNYALYPHMSVFDNLAFGLRNRGIPEPQVRREVERVAEMMEIARLLRRKPQQLSGGEQQRVALGRCVVRRPRVFLFDEPLSNLDAKLRAQMRIELRRLRERESTTSLYVTHDQLEAMTLGDRVVIMRDGRIQQVGAPLDIYNRPANRFVAGFVGAPGMNFVEGTLDPAEGHLWFHAPGMRLPVPDAYGTATGPVTIGIRPDHLELVGDGDERQLSVDAVVDIVEHTGSEILVQARCGETALTVSRVEPEAPVRAGDQIRLAISPRHLHWFDAVTGLALATERHKSPGSNDAS
jgi:multiple sugar transport system ATP-binding protein